MSGLSPGFLQQLPHCFLYFTLEAIEQKKWRQDCTLSKVLQQGQVVFGLENFER